MNPVPSLPITVVIPTLDAARELPRCLASVGWAGEVIVVDGGSKDDTVSVAIQGGARVLSLAGGWICDQRNAGVVAAGTPWVLSLDADEAASPELVEELRDVVAAPRHDGYRLRRRNFRDGRELSRGSWSRDWVLRLFRRDRRYLRSRVHERLEPAGVPGTLRATLVHESYRDLAHYVEKLNRYAQWSALDLHERGRRGSLLSCLTRPPGRFLRSYLLDGAWRDGRRGVIESGLGAWGVFLKHAWLLELNRPDPADAG